MSVICENGSKGTRITPCSQIYWDDLKGIVPIRKGWSKDIVNDLVAFAYADYVNDVKSGNFYPLTNLDDYTDDTADNEDNVSSSQVTSEIRLAKKRFTMMSFGDYNKHKAIWDKRAPNGGVWDYAFIFSSSIVFAKSSDGTKLTGFDGGYFSVSPRKVLSGTDKEQTMFKIELANTFEWNERAVTIPFTEIGDVDRYEGIADVKLEIVGTPSISDTTVNVKVTTLGDVPSNVFNILDLEGSNFALLGTAANGFTSSVYNATQEYYELTVGALAAGTLKVRLNDGTYDVGTDTLGQSYRGTSNEVTVA